MSIKNRKFAFTLAEVIMVLSITGVVALSAMQVNRYIDENAYPKLYIKAYNTLKTATYNVQQEVAIHNQKENMKARDNNLAMADPEKLKKFPGVKSTEQPTATQLCTSITKYLNKVEESCNITNVQSGVGSKLATNFSLKDTTPSFITSDNMYYYITSLGSGNKMSSFLVFVDLNGSRNPNTLFFKKRKPDTVAFLIHKDTAQVVPVGYPTYDLKYLQTRVIFSNPDMEQDYTILLPYIVSKKVAYNDKEYTLDPMSIKKLGSTNSSTGGLDIDSYLEPTYPQNMIKPEKPSTIDSCSQTGYSTTTDFPPCTIDINMHH